MNEQENGTGQAGAGGEQGAPSAPAVASAPASETPTPASAASTGGSDQVQWGAEPAAQAAAAESEPPAAADAPPVSAAPPPTPADFTTATLANGQHEIRLATGQVYQGATEAEAWAQVARGQVEASRTITELRKGAGGNQPEGQGAAPAAAASTPASTPLTEIDPATLAVFDLLAPALGLQSGKEMISAFQQMRDQTNQFQAATHDMQLARTEQEFFAAAPDFVQTPGNFEKMAQTLVQFNLQPTKDNLLFVHDALKSRGVYEIPPPPPARASNGQFAPRTNSMPLPPSAAAPTPPSAPKDLWAMSDAEFEAEYRRVH